MSDALVGAKRHRQYSYMALAAGLSLPGVVLSRLHPDPPDPLLAVIFGLAIVGAAFLGLGWAMVVFIAWRRYRRVRGERIEGVALERSHAVELAFLSVATVYSLTLPLK